MRTYEYRAVFEPGDEGAIVVTFPDVPEAITQGDDEADAHAQAADALGVALLTYIELGRPLPVAKAKKGESITVDAEIGAKLAVIEAFGASGLSKSELGRRLGKDEKEVRRILDPSHSTKLSALKAALASVGQRLVVGVEPLVKTRAHGAKAKTGVPRVIEVAAVPKGRRRRRTIVDDVVTPRKAVA